MYIMPITKTHPRSQSLKLYRDLLRLIKKVPDEQHRAELRKWIRDDFESTRHLTDEAAIKSHITRGRISEKKLQSSLYLADCK